MVHGDLKGVGLLGLVPLSISNSPSIKANILIDETGRACLADFGLVTIISDATSLVSSSSPTHGGTYRWMSPELFCPEDFGLEDSRRTKHSDCYALGMVIYEVLSGQVPFSRYDTYAAIVKIGRGERPGRPQGAERKLFTDVVWRVLECCWASKRDDRPSIEDVLQVLEEASRSWTPLSPLVEGPPVADSPTWSLSALSDSIVEKSSGNGEAPSLTQAAPSQPPQTLLQKGDADDNNAYPSFGGFSDPLQEDLSPRDLGVYPKNPNGSDLLESGEQWSKISLIGLSDAGLIQPSTVPPFIPWVRLLRICFDKFLTSRVPVTPIPILDA